MSSPSDLLGQAHSSTAPIASNKSQLPGNRQMPPVEKKQWMARLRRILIGF
jgi:hypothetical protein